MSDEPDLEHLINRLANEAQAGTEAAMHVDFARFLTDETTRLILQAIATLNPDAAKRIEQLMKVCFCTGFRHGSANALTRVAGEMARYQKIFESEFPPKKGDTP